MLTKCKDFYAMLIVPRSCNAVLSVSKLTISKHFVMLTEVFEHLNALLTISKHHKACLYSSNVMQC